MKKSNIDDFNTYCGRMEEIKFRIAKIETILAGGSIGEEIFNTESTQTGNMSAQSWKTEVGRKRRFARRLSTMVESNQYEN